MRDLKSLALEHGDLLLSTGYALETLANLLGADGSQHELTPDEYSGLTHAVRALSGYAGAAGLVLSGAAVMADAQEGEQ